MFPGIGGSAPRGHIESFRINKLGESSPATRLCRHPWRKRRGNGREGAVRGPVRWPGDTPGAGSAVFSDRRPCRAAQPCRGRRRVQRHSDVGWNKGRETRFRLPAGTPATPCGLMPAYVSRNPTADRRQMEFDLSGAGRRNRLRWRSEKEMVARDRIELPTRGFSVPCSTD